MERKTAADFDQELLILFDAYVHGAIDRRGFLDKAKKFAVGGVTAAMLLDALNPNFAEAQQVAPDDKRLSASDVEFPSPQGSGKMSGYLVRPAASTAKPALGFYPYDLGEGRVAVNVTLDDVNGEPLVQTITIEAKEIDIAWAMPASYVTQIRDLEPQGIRLVTAKAANAACSPTSCRVGSRFRSPRPRIRLSGLSSSCLRSRKRPWATIFRGIH